MKLFVSYRRDDARAFTERICDRLVERFGKSCVFKDVDSIPAGADFRKRLRDALNQCEVFLCVMGGSWINSKNQKGDLRLDDPADFVRIEIETAMAREIPIIPILADPAHMVRANELPPSLAALAFRQAIAIRPDPHFRQDVNHLIGSIEKFGHSSPRLRETITQQQLASVKPLKNQAILDRRLATEVVVLFSRAGTSALLDQRLPCLLSFGIALYEQLLLENQYGSTLHHVISKEPEILRDSLCIINHREPPREDEGFVDMTTEASELWSNDPQFQLAVSQYERKKSGGLGAVDENIAYIQRTLHLARQFDAAILPHPDRWPLFRWIFENSLLAAKTPSDFCTAVSLPDEPTDSKIRVPPERKDRLRCLATRLPIHSSFPIGLIRYTPMTYPFPRSMARRYDLEDLATGPTFSYEFCAPVKLSNP